MADNDTYIDMNGGVHDTAKECVESNLSIEGANSGGYPAGGNCGQDPDNVPDEGK
jgi:hypothetical protein